MMIAGVSGLGIGSPALGMFVAESKRMVHRSPLAAGHGWHSCNTAGAGAWNVQFGFVALLWGLRMLRQLPSGPPVVTGSAYWLQDLTGKGNWRGCPTRSPSSRPNATDIYGL